jgi:outer membrane lipoprotein SlyB
MLSCGLLVGGCASGKGESYTRAGYNFGKIEKVAVVDVTGAVRGEPVKIQITDYFNMELMKRGFVPVERSQIESLLKEQKFQASDVTTKEDAARVGKILNVPAVVLVNIPKYGEDLNMTAKMIDVEDGSILWIGEGTGSTGKTLSTIVGAVAGAAVGAAVGGHETKDRVIGGVIGGVLGGVAGNALSPQQADQVRKIIKKVCEKMPSRGPVIKQ